MMYNDSKVPYWYWGIAIFFMLWNIMGLYSFYAHTFITDAALAKLPDNERALYAEYPFWVVVVFAIAVITGTIGSIGLLLRNKWAKSFFILSLLAIIPQMTHNIFFTSTIEVYGTVQSLTMPILVTIFGVFLIWFSHYAIQRNWLQ